MYFRIYKEEKNSAEHGLGMLSSGSSTAGEWRWTLYSDNHKKIADSGESYINKQDCIKGINLVKGTTNNTPIHEN